MESTIILLAITMLFYLGTFIMFGYLVSCYYDSVGFSDDLMTEEAIDQPNLESNELQVDDFIIDVENRHPNLT